MEKLNLRCVRDDVVHEQDHEWGTETSLWTSCERRDQVWASSALEVTRDAVTCLVCLAGGTYPRG